MNVPLTSRYVEPGQRVGSIDVRHTAVRVVLFGHQFSKHLAAQVGYTRPVWFIKFNGLNNTDIHRTVSVAVGDFTLKSAVPLTSRLSLYGETGLGVVTRSGVSVDDVTLVEDAAFGSPLFGGGLEYHRNPWDFVAGATYVPAHPLHNQSEILFGSLGFRYNIRPLSAATLKDKQQSGIVRPRNTVQLGVSTNYLGYGANNLLSGKIFWGGFVEISRGVALRYQRNVFLGRKVFALDLGASAAYWQSSGRERFATLSVFPLLRFTVYRTKSADYYICYSVAGPTFISKRILDSQDIGRRFTFQDIIGTGVFLGKKRNILAELSISHYSNGNIFPSNPGTKIPLTLSLAYGF